MCSSRTTEANRNWLDSTKSFSLEHLRGLARLWHCWTGSGLRPHLRSIPQRKGREYTQKMNSSIKWSAEAKTICHPHISIFWQNSTSAVLMAAIVHRCTADLPSTRKQIYIPGPFSSFWCLVMPPHGSVLKWVLVNLCMCHVSLCMPV